MKNKSGLTRVHNVKGGGKKGKTVLLISKMEKN